MFEGLSRVFHRTFSGFEFQVVRKDRKRRHEGNIKRLGLQATNLS